MMRLACRDETDEAQYCYPVLHFDGLMCFKNTATPTKAPRHFVALLHDAMDLCTRPHRYARFCH